MNDSGEENNYISGNSEIISSKNVSSRGLLHPLRGSPLPEGAKVAATPNEISYRSINPNLKYNPFKKLTSKTLTVSETRVRSDRGQHPGGVLQRTLTRTNVGVTTHHLCRRAPPFRFIISCPQKLWGFQGDFLESPPWRSPEAEPLAHPPRPPRQTQI